MRLSGKDLDMFAALKKHLGKGIVEPTDPMIIRGCIRYVYQREIEGESSADMITED